MDCFPGRTIIEVAGRDEGETTNYSEQGSIRIKTIAIGLRTNEYGDLSLFWWVCLISS